MQYSRLCVVLFTKKYIYYYKFIFLLNYDIYILHEEKQIFQDNELYKNKCIYLIAYWDNLQK